MTARTAVWFLVALAVLLVAVVLVWMGLSAGAEELAPYRHKARSMLA